jgi:hypothetical protein
MISNKPITKKILLFIASIFVFSIVNTNAQDGKALFNANCASCHNVFKAATGPALGGLEGRGPWSDRNKIYEWIKNPSAFMAKDPYTAGLKTQYGSVMNAIPSLAPKEIDAIVTYINKAYTDGPGGPTPPGGNNPAADDSGNKNWIIFGILSLVLAIIALILMQVNSNLKKLSDDKEGILRPEPVPVFGHGFHALLYYRRFLCYQRRCRLGSSKRLSTRTTYILFAQSTCRYQSNQLFILPWQCF